MATINFDVTAFRAIFPAFASSMTFPDSTLQAYWDTAILYIYNQSGGCYGGAWTLPQQTRAINLMTAHLAALSVLIAAGQTPGIVTGASIDKVSVTLEPPPAPNQWQYWLQTTPYGAQLLALLQIIGAGGGYFGGRPELSAFRRAGGYRWR